VTVEISGPGTTSVRALEFDAPKSTLGTLAPAGTSTIVGRVADAVSGASLPGMTVALNGRQADTVTDGAGYFRFAQLAAGTYTLRVQQPGYAPVTTAAVPVEDGRIVDDVVLEAGRHGSISGIVRDDAGDPVVGMPVLTLRRRVINFQPILMPGAGDKTNDLGQFTIENLPAGEYFLCACAGIGLPVDARLMRELGATAPGGPDFSRIVDHTVLVYPPTWFPGTTRGVDSPMLAVTHSDDRLGLDITMTGVTPRTVSGQVLDPTGSSTRPLRVYLVQEGDLEGAVGISQIDTTSFTADGRFRFTGVPQGDFIAVVAPADGKPGSTGSVSVSVGTSDVTDLVVPLGGDRVTVSGRLSFQGHAALPTGDTLKQSRVGLFPVKATTASLVGVASNGIGYGATPDQLGNFEITGVLPGDYVVSVGIPGSEWRNVETVMGSGRVSADGLLTVGDDGAWEVIITLTDTPRATLGVSATLGRYQAVNATRIVVFPATRAMWLEPHRYRDRFPSSFVGRDGTATFEQLPPGDYLVALIPQSEFELSISSLERWAATARPVTLRSGARTEITLSQKIPSPGR
jgi:hypothetical protein